MAAKGAESEDAVPEAGDGAVPQVTSMARRLYDAERDEHHRSALEASIIPGAVVDEDTGAVSAAAEEEYYFEEKPRMRDPCCTKWTFRLYSSLLCCWVLPLLTVAPAYFLLSYSDKDADYSEFELPACKDRASFYCLEGRTMASLLRAVAVWPPFLYTLIVSNGYLLLRAKRAHDQYIRARKRENAQRIRKDFLTKWESAAIREQRLAREQAIYDRKVELERARRRRQYLTIEFFEAARARLNFTHDSAMEAVFWFLGRRRRVRWANIYWAMAFVLFVFIPVTSLLPAFVENYDALSSATPGPRGKRAVLAIVVILFPAIALIGFAPTIAARVRRGMATMRKLRARARRAAARRRQGEEDEDEEDEDDGSDESDTRDMTPEEIIRRSQVVRVRVLRESFASEREEILVRYFRQLCSPVIGSIAFGFLFFFFVPLCVVLPVISVLENDHFASQVDGVTGANTALFVTVGAPLAFFLCFGLAKTLSKRRHLRNIGDDPMDRLITLAKDNGLRTWDIGEWPNWSIGHAVATTGLRPRRSPFLHRGHRVIRRRAAAAFFLFVIVPLSTALPLAIYAADQLDATDTGAGVRAGTSTTICWAVAIVYPGMFFLFYGARLLWNVVPRPLRRAAPWLAAWFILFGALPLLAAWRALPTATGVIKQLLGLLLFIGPTSVGAVTGALIVRHMPTITQWVQSIRVEKPYRDMISLLGLQYGAASLLIPAAPTVWGALLYVNWDGHSAAALLAFSTATLILGFVWAALLIYGLASAVYLDILRPDAGLQQLFPVVAVTCGLAVGGYGLVMVDGWAHRGIPVNSDDFTSLRFVRFAIVLCGVATACMAVLAKATARIASEKRRFGYHPSDIERANPLAAQLFAAREYRLEERRLRQPMEAGNSADAEEDAYHEVPSADDESADEGRVDVAGIAQELRQTSLFKSLSVTKAQQLVNAMTLQSFGVGQRILTQGVRGSSVFVLTAGRVRVTHTLSHNLSEQPPAVRALANRYDVLEEEQRLATLSPVSVFGELGLLASVKRTANVIALVPTECLTVDRATFVRVCGERQVQQVYKDFGVVDLYWQQMQQRQQEEEAARRRGSDESEEEEEEEEEGDDRGALITRASRSSGRKAKEQ